MKAQKSFRQAEPGTGGASATANKTEKSSNNALTSFGSSDDESGRAWKTSRSGSHQAHQTCSSFCALPILFKTRFTTG